MADEPAVVVGKTYDFVLWLMPKVEKFSRSYRFSLGERLIAYGLVPSCANWSTGPRPYGTGLEPASPAGYGGGRR